MVQYFLKGIQLFPGVGVAWVQLLIPIIIERFTFQGRAWGQNQSTQGVGMGGGVPLPTR